MSDYGWSDGQTRAIGGIRAFVRFREKERDWVVTVVDEGRKSGMVWQCVRKTERGAVRIAEKLMREDAETRLTCLLCDADVLREWLRG